MPDTPLLLADLLTLNTAGLADYEAREVLDDAPLLRAMYSEVASNGTVHRYLKQTGVPVVGFRTPTAGRDHSKSTDTAVSIDLKLLDASFNVACAIADGHVRGAEALLQREAIRHLKQALKHMEKTLIYGTANDAAGFSGLIQATGIDALADPMVINAGGAANRTSVYFIRTAPDDTACTLIAGNDGDIAIGETVRQLVDDGTGKKLFVYATQIEAWMSAKLGTAYDVARIANIGTAANTTLTDAMLSDCLATIPEEFQNNLLIVMNRRSRGQLQKSRTSYHPLGQPAPLPTEWEGFPIITTSSITNAETAVA